MAAGSLAELCDQGADRARGAGDHQGFAGFGPTRVHEAKPSGPARHSQDAQSGRDRCCFRIQLLQFVGVRFVKALPATVTQHPIAARKSRALRGHHLSDGTGTLHDA